MLVDWHGSPERRFIDQVRTALSQSDSSSSSGLHYYMSEIANALRSYDLAQERTTATQSRPPVQADGPPGIAERYAYADRAVDQGDRLLPRAHVVELVALAYGDGAQRSNLPHVGL